MSIIRLAVQLLIPSRRKREPTPRMGPLRRLFSAARDVERKGASAAVGRTTISARGARWRGLRLVLRGNSHNASGYAAAASAGGVVSLIVFAIGYLGVRGVSGGIRRARRRAGHGRQNSADT